MRKRKIKRKTKKQIDKLSIYLQNIIFFLLGIIAGIGLHILVP